MVDSCRSCPECERGLEQYCRGGITFTYNSVEAQTGGTTYGGYSDRIVVDESFVLRVPSNLDLAAAAPLLCAGITMYSPLRSFGGGKGSRVGIVGLGGLGHMGVKLAHAFGAEVVVYTTSPGKSADARRLGADDVVVTRRPEELARHAGRLDLLVDTVALSHDLDPYLEQLATDGTLCLVGVPQHPHPSPSAGKLIPKRRRIAGSMIGGIPETQEMLDFCAARGIVSDIELIPIRSVNDAYARLLASDVRYRFVIDMASLS
jgi:uncharacterized zinc-type alcohol dehydrogenase-like protein